MYVLLNWALIFIPVLVGKYNLEVKKDNLKMFGLLQQFEALILLYYLMIPYFKAKNVLNQQYNLL